MSVGMGERREVEGQRKERKPREKESQKGSGKVTRTRLSKET